MAGMSQYGAKKGSESTLRVGCQSTLAGSSTDRLVSERKRSDRKSHMRNSSINI